MEWSKKEPLIYAAVCISEEEVSERVVMVEKPEDRIETGRFLQPISL